MQPDTVSGMLVPLLALGLAVPGKAPDTTQDITKGASLLRVCKAELRLMQPDGLQTADPGDLVNGAYCVGYVNGFISNLIPARGSICADKHPLAELVEAYVRFMEQSPRSLEQDKRIGLRLALEQAFPCPVLTDAPESRRPLRRDRL